MKNKERVRQAHDPEPANGKDVHFMGVGTGRQESIMYGKENVPGWNCLYVNSKLFTAVNTLEMYLHLTGAHNLEALERVRMGSLTTAESVVNGNPEVGELLRLLYGLFQVSSYRHLLTAYEAGRVSPGLKAILDYQPQEEIRTMETETGFGSEFKSIVWAAVQDGKIDFSTFNENGDPTPDWFLKYSLRPNPIPGLFGSIHSMIAVGPSDSPTLELFHKHLKREMKRWETTLLQEGLPAESISALASEIKERYEALEQGTAPAKMQRFAPYPYALSPFPYGGEYEAGFAVDLQAGVIHDMRPYAKELRELLKPDYEPLKEFFYALRRYASDYEKESSGTEGEKEQEKEFIGDAAFLMLKNSPETNAIASASTGFAAISVQQELPGLNDNDEPVFDYKTKVPIKSGDVIIKVSEQPRGKALSPGTEKLRILFDSLYTQFGQTDFFLPIYDYMEYCRRDKDKPASPESRRKFKRALLSNLSVLKHTSFSAQMKGVKDKGEIGILGGYIPYPNNRIRILLEKSYCATLDGRNAGQMQMTKWVFRLDEKNPHLVTMLRKLSLNRTMYSNINQGDVRAHRISIKSLYENDASFPSITALMKTRKYRQSVILPMFNAIKILTEEGYILSRYVDTDGIEHEPEEMETVSFTDFIDPRKWLLEYELLNPETGEVFKENVEQRLAAEQRRQAREEQNKLAHAKKVVAAAKKKKQE